MNNIRNVIILALIQILIAGCVKTYGRPDMSEPAAPPSGAYDVYDECMDEAKVKSPWCT